MKKIIAFVLICIIVFATVGCVEDNNVSDDITNGKETVIYETTVENKETTNDLSVTVEPVTENNEPEQKPAEEETTNATTEKHPEDITIDNNKKEPVVSTTAVITTICDTQEETPKDTVYIDETTVYTETTATTETPATETTNDVENNEPFIREHKYVFTADNATKTYSIESLSNDDSTCNELLSHNNCPDENCFDCVLFIPAGAWFTVSGSAWVGYDFLNEDGTWSQDEYRDITKDQWLYVFGEYSKKAIWDDFNKTWKDEYVGIDYLNISVFYDIEIG